MGNATELDWKVKIKRLSNKLKKKNWKIIFIFLLLLFSIYLLKALEAYNYNNNNIIIF